MTSVKKTASAITSHATSPGLSSPALLLGIWHHLSRRRHIQFCFLLVVMVCSGLAEIVSLGAMVPFLAVLSNPQLLWKQQLIQELSSKAGLTEAGQLLIPATLIFATAAILAAVIRLANVWINGRFAAAIGSELSCEAYRRTLYQPYSVHVQRNSAEVITGATTQIALTAGALNNVLRLLTAAVVAISIFIGLLAIDMQVALGSAVLFGTAYLVLAITARRQLRTNGQKIAQFKCDQLKALQEGLGAIRDVLLDGSQSTYLQIYKRADRPQRELEAQNAFIGSSPRYVLETLGLVAIASIGCIAVLKGGNGTYIVPLLGTLALGAQRLLPALQQIYSSWAALKSYNKAIAIVLEMLNQPMPPQANLVRPLQLRQGIKLDGICFRYLPEQSNVVNGINLEIHRGERIGLIGTTGSGKSTTVDILMALLEPTDGRLLVDGEDLHDPEYPERLIAWRAAIAHVPQNIYLADSSIAENIAFGLPHNQIDFARVKQAAMQAQIANFIEASPGGYQSFVGERGFRLSGGQRQRIGIARALYKNASVLVFDEATSALDSSTEEAVMAAVEGLSKELTIVIIAHRLSTVQRCDRVIRLEEGSVSAEGPPQLVS